MTRVKPEVVGDALGDKHEQMLSGLDLRIHRTAPRVAEFVRERAGLMKVIGRVESLWRYPVKSMRGEERTSLFLGFAGVYGDRYYAFHDAAAQKGFPYLTARQQGKMLLYRPVYRRSETGAPPHLAEAVASAPGATPLYGGADEFMVDVETPAGERLSIDDPKLLDELSEGLREGHALSLLRSDRALTDCRPISMISLQTVAQLSEETGAVLDKRRFRANIYVDLAGRAGFEEDKLVGMRVRIGDEAVVAFVERDPRCKMITLDPETAEPNPEIMKQVSRGHEGRAGLYGAVMVEGIVRVRDEVVWLS